MDGRQYGRASDGAGRETRAAGAVRTAVIAAAAMALLPFAAPHAQDTAPTRPTPSVVLIFDGSGSMWGKLPDEKQTKLDAARAAVHDALGRLPKQAMRLGLVSFGHRRSGDCRDVQTILAPESSPSTAFADRVTDALDNLDPRGKGPLTAALKEAAATIAKLPPPRHIVMLHDDPDNCQADPCEALAELQRTAPGVIVSIIGIGLKPDDATRYQCLTRPTGGMHVDGQSGAQLAAGVDAVLRFAAKPPAPPLVDRSAQSIDAADRAAAVAAAVESARPKPLTLSKSGPPALHLRALLSKDRLPLGNPVHWQIRAADANTTARPLAEADGIEVVLPLPAAAYRVTATSGFVSGEAQATVASEGETAAEIDFAAAELALTSPLAGDASVLVSERAVARPGPPPVSGAGRLWPLGLTRLMLPAGSYTLHFQQGRLEASVPVDAVAGQSKAVDSTLAGGRLQLSLLPTAGPPLPGAARYSGQTVIYALEVDDPDAPHGRREIARSAAPSPEFVVPSGVYTVSARRGAFEAHERVAVAAGEVVRRALPLQSARLVLAARIGAGSVALPAEVGGDIFRLTRLDIENERPVVFTGPDAIVDVPPGRYRIEARHGAAAIKAEQTLDVRSGDFKPVTLDYQAGALRIDVPPAMAALPDAAWYVLDDAGRPLVGGTESKAAYVLQQGRYLVRWVIDGRRLERAVDIHSGAATAIRLGTEP